MPTSLSLYRALVRATRGLPAPIARKIVFNARQVFRFYSQSPGEAVKALQADAEAAVRTVTWLRGLPKVRGGAKGRWPEPGMPAWAC